MKKIFTTFAILITITFYSCSKKSNPSPNTLQLITNGYGHTQNSGFVVPMSIVNQNGVTIFHTDTLNFSASPITYNIAVNSGDILKATWNSNVKNLQISSPVVDMQFAYGGKQLAEIEGGIYNTTTYYNNNPTVNTATLHIP